VKGRKGGKERIIMVRDGAGSKEEEWRIAGGVQTIQ
jgi:hypothetical protein